LRKIILKNERTCFIKGACQQINKKFMSEITIHKASDFIKMRAAGKLAAEILDFIAPFVKAGITTDELNKLCHDEIIRNGAIPAPLNYKGFPKSICTSVNHVVCHGIPNEKQLKNDDIVNIDVTVILDGWFGDSSRMYFPGEPSIKAKRLTQVTYDCMMLGIEQVRPGAHLGDIGNAIQTYAEKNGFSVVRDYCGHGIGRIFHTEPSVLHYGKKNSGIVLQEGMFFTVEPMINAGDYGTILSKHDGWTVTTRDKSLSAQFEHTIGVTKDGFEIFTSSPKGLDFPPYQK
jgi:methionyl aminopeptidase